MEAWRLIQENAMETRRADMGAMISALGELAEQITRRRGVETAWQHLGSSPVWGAMTQAERNIYSLLIGRIEAAA